MGIDEECEISFETLSDKAANASRRKPLGRITSSGELTDISRSEKDTDEQQFGNRNS